mgnify:CR=1 FL=1
MSTYITCPTCQSSFVLEDVLTDEMEKSIKQKYELQNKELVNNMRKKEQELWQKEQEFEEKKKQENILFQQRLDKEKEKITQYLTEEIRKKAEQEQHLKIQFLETELSENKEKIKQLNEKELTILELNKQLNEQKEQETFKLQKLKLELEQEIKNQIQEQASQQAADKYEFAIKELRMKLEQQSKLIEEQKRKMEQGSMEQQGEVQEIILKEKLAILFPFDLFEDVKKGRKGGDIIHTVRNENGIICGQILYESKNTVNWLNDWVTKLENDVRTQKAHAGILVTQTLPKNIKNIGRERTIWICGFAEIEGVAAMIRDAIIHIHQARQSQENKGDKMVMLYDYLTGNEFRQKWDAIIAGYHQMKKSLEKQRDFYNKTLAEQEQIANGILINANNFLGSIKGIAGSGLDEIKQIE